MINSTLYKILGVIGLLIVTKAIFIRGHRHQSILFACGGFFLLAYSIYLKDVVFVVLQSVFIVSSLYEWHVTRKKHSAHVPPLT